MSQPPEQAIAAAITMAGRATCQHSQRGAVVWDPETDALYFGGWNGPPRGRDCDGSTACVRSCAERCIHAETRALRLVHASGVFGDASLRGELGLASPDVVPRLELVHVKVIDGKLVAGKGPCCAQCSKEVLESGIAAVWLYHADATPRAKWIRWPAMAFDDESRRAAGVY